MDNRTQTSKAKFFCGGKNLPHFFRRPADILSTCSHDELLRKCATPKELNAPDLFERQLMDIFEKIKNVLVRRSYPETEFGLQPMEFFVALLSTCPEGSRLTFDQCLPKRRKRRRRGRLQNKTGPLGQGMAGSPGNFELIQT